MKKYLKKLLFRVPFFANFYFKRFTYRADLNEITLRSKLQQLGHSLDLYLSDNKRPPFEKLKECEFLIKAFQKKQIPLDEAGKWAVEKFTEAKFNLKILADKATPKTDHPPGKSFSFTEVLLGRRSLRKWSTEDIDIGEMEKVIGLAEFAPSSCNRQPWQILFINKPEDKDFLLNYFPNKFWLSAPLLMVVLMNPQVYQKNENHFVYLDAGCFIQNILLALHNENYGACWIGFKGWDSAGNVFTVKNSYDLFYQRFNLAKEQHIPVSMIAVGKTEENVKAPVRKSTDALIINHFLTDKLSQGKIGKFMITINKSDENNNS